MRQALEMSATETPILDPENIISDPDDPFFGGSAFGKIYDPIDRLLTLSVGPSIFESEGYFYTELAELNYIPMLNMEYIQSGKALQDLMQKRMPIMNCFFNYKFYGDILTGIVKYDRSRGLGYGEVRVSRSLTYANENPIECQFWPDNVSKDYKRLATYFLHCLMPRVQYKASHIRIYGKGPIDKFGVIIDPKWADFVGLDSFPDHEILDDGNIMIFKTEGV